jgi:heme-degrading monooxygenase HmoA
MLVMSEWQSLAAFQAWESGVDHRSSTSPLRPYQDRERARFFEIFEVAAEF